MLNPLYNLPEAHFVAGESERFLFDLKTPRGTDFNAEGCDVGFAIINYANKHGDPIVVKDATILMGANGVMNLADVQLDPEDTLYLYGRYIYQLTVKYEDGTTDIPGHGIIDISRNIHTDFIKG